jgi:hypothetical protein
MTTKIKSRKGKTMIKARRGKLRLKRGIDAEEGASQRRSDMTKPRRDLDCVQKAQPLAHGERKRVYENRRAPTEPTPLIS